MLRIPSLFLLTISPYIPYCEIYPSLDGNTVELIFNIPFFGIIYGVESFEESQVVLSVCCLCPANAAHKEGPWLFVSYQQARQ